MVEAQALRANEIASCRIGMDRSHRRLLAVYSAAQTVEEGVSIVKELEVLLKVVGEAEAEALEVQRQEAEAEVQMVLKTVVVVEGQAVRRLELAGLERVTLTAAEGPCLTACETTEAELVASCQSVEVAVASRLCSKPETRQV